LITFSAVQKGTGTISSMTRRYRRSNSDKI
jgi:hypothetical protein